MLDVPMEVVKLEETTLDNGVEDLTGVDDDPKTSRFSYVVVSILWTKY